jgi:hypothetical protein
MYNVHLPYILPTIPFVYYLYVVRTMHCWHLGVTLLPSSAVVYACWAGFSYFSPHGAFCTITLPFHHAFFLLLRHRPRLLYGRPTFLFVLLPASNVSYCSYAGTSSSLVLFAERRWFVCGRSAVGAAVWFGSVLLLNSIVDVSACAVYAVRAVANLCRHRRVRWTDAIAS